MIIIWEDPLIIKEVFPYKFILHVYLVNKKIKKYQICCYRFYLECLQDFYEWMTKD